MRRGAGGWQLLGEEIDRAVRAGDPAQRSVIVERCAVEMGRNAAGVKRLYEAYCYVSRFPDGLTTNAPFAAIEILARIEQRSYLRAAELRPRLFRGELTIRDMADQERDLLIRLADIPTTVRDLSLAFIISLVESHPQFTARALGDHVSSTAHGRTLGANADDAELGTDHPAWALIVSPEIRCSVLFGRDLSDMLNSVARALSFYDQVFAIVSSAEERSAVAQYFQTEVRIRDEHRRTALLQSLLLIDAPAT